MGSSIIVDSKFNSYTDSCREKRASFPLKGNKELFFELMHPSANVENVLRRYKTKRVEHICDTELPPFSSTFCGFWVYICTTSPSLPTYNLHLVPQNLATEQHAQMAPPPAIALLRHFQRASAPQPVSSRRTADAHYFISNCVEHGAKRRHELLSVINHPSKGSGALSCSLKASTDVDIQHSNILRQGWLILLP